MYHTEDMVVNLNKTYRELKFWKGNWLTTTNGSQSSTAINLDLP